MAETEVDKLSSLETILQITTQRVTVLEGRFQSTVETHAKTHLDLKTGCDQLSSYVSTFANAKIKAADAASKATLDTPARLREKQALVDQAAQTMEEHVQALAGLRRVAESKMDSIALLQQQPSASPEAAWKMCTDACQDMIKFASQQEALLKTAQARLEMD